MRRRIILAVTGVAVVLVIAGIVFVAIRANPGPATLTGHAWALTRLIVDGHEQPISSESTPTISFNPQNHTVNGFSGCNSYSGSYTILGSSLRFDNMQTTLMACLDATVMEQESAYSGALGRVGSYHIDGDTLTLEGDSGRVVMTFRPGNR